MGKLFIWLAATHSGARGHPAGHTILAESSVAPRCAPAANRGIKCISRIIRTRRFLAVRARHVHQPIPCGDASRLRYNMLRATAAARRWWVLLQGDRQCPTEDASMESQILAGIVQRFEQAWQTGPPPRLGIFMRQFGPSSFDLAGIVPHRIGIRLKIDGRARVRLTWSASRSWSPIPIW